MKMLLEIRQPASGWTDCTKSVIGVEVDGLNIIIEVLAGANLHEAAFVALLKGPLSDHLKKAAEYSRTHAIKTEVQRGMSGRRALIIHWLEDFGRFARPKRKEVLYISGHRKIAEVRCFLPDLIPFLSELDGEGADEVYAREIREVDRSQYHFFGQENARQLTEAFLGA